MTPRPLKRGEVVVVLSPAEARALSHAIGNTVEHPDAVEALFGPHERRTLYRAVQKFDKAITDAQGWTR